MTYLQSGAQFRTQQILSEHRESGQGRPQRVYEELRAALGMTAEDEEVTDQKVDLAPFGD